MYKKFNNLTQIEGGASRKKIYRQNNKGTRFIILDFVANKEEFNNHLKIYDILKNVDISIPKIYEISFEDKIIVTEDFGNERFDKIINKYDIKNLLEIAVESLIIINNSTVNKISSNNLSIYNYNIFYNELTEFIEFFFPYKNIDKSLTAEFFEIWEEHFNNLNFIFDAIIHKDFEFTNLMYLSEKKNHLKCGIIDFQSAFIGFKGWDLFSLLENPRIYFSRENNEKFIKDYYLRTNSKIEFDLFRRQYYFLNTSRHTRLLGRWVKFSKIDKNNTYLKYINTTIKRLKQSLNDLEIKELNYIYEKILS